MEPRHLVNPSNARDPVPSMKSLGGPPSTPHSIAQIYTQLRFMYTNSTTPSNFLCMRQKLLAGPPLCTTRGGGHHLLQLQGKSCSVSCTRHGLGPSYVFVLFLWSKVRHVCFPQSGLCPPQLLTSNLTRVKAEYTHPAQGAQSLFFNVLAE